MFKVVVLNSTVATTKDYDKYLPTVQVDRSSQSRTVVAANHISNLHPFNTDGYIL